jgi:hypothetical protein
MRKLREPCASRMAASSTSNAWQAIAKLPKFLAGEFKKALPPTLFFMVVFHAAALIRGLDEESFRLTPTINSSLRLCQLILADCSLLTLPRQP